MRNSFWFNFLVMPIGGIVVAAILGLGIAPLGQWFKKAPLVGDLFAQLCRSTNADCNRPDLLNNPESATKTIFFCAKDFSEIPTTFARVPARGEVVVIKWTSDHFEQAGFSAQKRCEEVSERFATLYSNGLLSYITSGKINGENVICATNENGGGCIERGLLFTLKPNENPEDAVKYLFDLKYDRVPVNASTSNPDDYYYTTSYNKLTINVEEALKKAPTESRTNW